MNRFLLLVVFLAQVGCGASNQTAPAPSTTGNTNRADLENMTKYERFILGMSKDLLKYEISTDYDPSANASVVESFPARDGSWKFRANTTARTGEGSADCTYEVNLSHVLKGDAWELRKGTAKIVETKGDRRLLGREIKLTGATAKEIAEQLREPVFLD